MASLIWRSIDGNVFIQSNISGFGNPNNTGENAVTIGFKGHQYFGGPNYVSGAQLWRTVGPTSITESIGCKLNKVYKTDNMIQFEYDEACRTPRMLQIFDISGKLIIHQEINNYSSAVPFDNLKGIFIYKVLFEDGLVWGGKVSVN